MKTGGKKRRVPLLEIVQKEKNTEGAGGGENREWLRISNSKPPKVRSQESCFLPEGFGFWKKERSSEGEVVPSKKVGKALHSSRFLPRKKKKETKKEGQFLGDRKGRTKKRGGGKRGGGD